MYLWSMTKVYIIHKVTRLNRSSPDFGDCGSFSRYEAQCDYMKIYYMNLPFFDEITMKGTAKRV